MCPMRRLVTGVLLVLGCGCTFPDLSIHGKDCNDAHPCPDPFLCVQRPVSPTERAGHCFRPGDAEPCPAEKFCDTEHNWVLECDADGFSSRLVADCAVEDELCNPDTGRCAASCPADDPSSCPAGETCDTGIGLCRPVPTCDNHQCVPPPVDQPRTSGGPAALDCFTDPVPPHTADPPTCTITGRVNLFPSKSGTDRTVGLNVYLYRQDDPYNRVEEPTTVFADSSDGDNGHYSFTAVPTGEIYMLQINEGESAEGVNVVTTVRGNVHLRADLCIDGVYTLGLDAVGEDEYQTYTQNLLPGPDYEARGLLVGRVADCDGNPMSGVTVGLAAPAPAPGRVYYFAEDDQILRPDTGLSATTTKGTYAAAGVPSCRNQVGFKALQSTTEMNLGCFEFTMRPKGVVILDLIPPDERLP